MQDPRQKFQGEVALFYKSNLNLVLQNRAFVNFQSVLDPCLDKLATNVERNFY